MATTPSAPKYRFMLISLEWLAKRDGLGPRIIFAIGVFCETRPAVNEPEGSPARSTIICVSGGNPL
jgi:hypothetical protein